MGLRGGADLLSRSAEAEGGGVIAKEGNNVSPSLARYESFFCAHACLLIESKVFFRVNPFPVLFFLIFF